MNWNFFKRWFRDYTIILILTALISLFLNLVVFVEFSENTLLWMTSTIVQAFGALMAIVIAIGLFEKERITKKVDEHIAETKSGTRRLIRGKSPKGAIMTLKEQRSLWPIWYPIQSIAVLVAISLAIMMFIGSSYVWNNYAKTVFFVFLVLFAIYTLQTLIHEISKTFSEEKVNTASK